MLNTPLTIWPALILAVGRDEEEFVTELRHFPEGWLGVAALALIVAICWAVTWMYRHEGRIGASARLRTVLAVLRCLVLLTLAVILLEPVRVRILRKWIESYTIVLVDDSSSMDLEDTYRDKSARERVNRALDSDQLQAIRRTDVVEPVLSRDNRQFLRRLAANNRVKLYTFSDEPRSQGTIRASWEESNSRAADFSPGGPSDPATSSHTTGDAQTAAPSVQSENRPPTPLLGADQVPTRFSATGPATNIERAVRRTVEALGSAPIAAVVVLSDGGFNQGASAEDTAHYARERRLPLHVIGIGDPSSPRNVRVSEVLAPENAFQNDPFPVSARLTAEGLEGETLTVQLRERDATRSGEGRVVATKSVVVGPGGLVEQVSFRRRQDHVGRFIYTVEVPVLESESVAEDNSRQTTVNVIDSRTRVLLVAGGPSWEYRFLSRLLERDDTFDVSCWLQSADLSAVRDGNTIIDHFPTMAEEFFEYDVIILMDPDKEEFDESWCKRVDTFVTRHGGGLLFAAARPHTPAFMRERSLKALHDLLPVTLDPEADLVLNRIGHYQLKGAPVEFPRTAYGHPVVQLGDDPVSTKLAWGGTGDVHWHYPVLREKPAATVLMRHSSPAMRSSFGGHVLVAVQFVGAGRTAFLGFDGTWRWRRYGADRFDRFWVQLVRYLAEGKLFGGSKRGMLLTQSDQVSLGQAVTVTARLFDERYKPLQRDQVRARYSVDGERTEFILTARSDQPGWFEGRFVPDHAGSYQISLKLPGTAPGDSVEIVRQIRVSRPNIEILRPQMDRAELVTLAEGSHGGRYFEVDEGQALPAAIPDLHAEIPVRSRPTTLWDNWMTLVLLVTLLSVEWAARKWNRLL